MLPVYRNGADPKTQQQREALWSVSSTHLFDLDAESVVTDGHVAQSGSSGRMFHDVITIDVGSRDWSLAISTTPTFEVTDVDRTTPRLVGLAGVLLRTRNRQPGRGGAASRTIRATSSVRGGIGHVPRFCSKRFTRKRRGLA